MNWLTERELTDKETSIVCPVEPEALHRRRLGRRGQLAVDGAHRDRHVALALQSLSLVRPRGVQRRDRPRRHPTRRVVQDQPRPGKIVCFIVDSRSLQIQFRSFPK